MFFKILLEKKLFRKLKTIILVLSEIRGKKFPLKINSPLEDPQELKTVNDYKNLKYDLSF